MLSCYCTRGVVSRYRQSQACFYSDRIQLVNVKDTCICSRRCYGVVEALQLNRLIVFLNWYWTH